MLDSWVSVLPNCDCSFSNWPFSACVSSLFSPVSSVLLCSASCVSAIFPFSSFSFVLSWSMAVRSLSAYVLFAAIFSFCISILLDSCSACALSSFLLSPSILAFCDAREYSSATSFIACLQSFIACLNSDVDALIFTLAFAVCIPSPFYSLLFVFPCCVHLKFNVF